MALSLRPQGEVTGSEKCLLSVQALADGKVALGREKAFVVTYIVGCGVDERLLG